MKTVVIALDGLKYNNNMCVLPPVLTLDDNLRVIFHTNPKVCLVDGEINTNYDLVISMDPTESEITRLSNGFVDGVRGKEYILNRALKKDQNTLLKVFNRKGYKGLYVPKQYSLNKDTGWLSGLNDSTVDKILLKSDLSARGIGQLILNKSKEGTLHGLVINVFKHLSSDLPLSEFNSVHGTIKLVSGLENYEGESIKHVEGYIDHLVAYELLEDVEREYRIWTDIDSEIYLVGERYLEDRGDGYSQGTYVKELRDVSELPRDLPKLLKDMNLPQMSVDVFQLKDGRWGLFEWQPQTGLGSVSSERVYEWHVNFIKKLIDRYC